MLVGTWAARPARAAWLFFLAGSVAHLILLRWALVQTYYAGAWVVCGEVALAAYYGSHWAAVGALWSWMRGKHPSFGLPITFGLLWMASESLQTSRFLLLSMPSHLAYTQRHDIAILQWASIGGAPLIGGFIAFVNASLASAICGQKTRVRRLAWAGGAVVAAHLAGWLMLGVADYESKPFTAGLLQSNFSAEMKQDPEYTVEMVRNAAEKSRAIASKFDLDLMVWPEALVMDNVDLPPVRDPIVEFTTGTGVPLFTGAARDEFETNTPRFYNSSAYFDAAGELRGEYDKLQLAPFGEYVPFTKAIPMIANLFPPMVGNLEAGTEFKTFDAGEHTFGPLICFEVLFPSMPEKLRQMGADFLIVVTNLGWFGYMNIVPTELEAARLRAIETRLALVHCTNTGISGVFDPYGRFAPVQGWFPRGEFAEIPDAITPERSLLLRMGGALPVAAPGRRLVPAGPRVVPNLALALSVILALIAVIVPRTADS